MASSPNGAYRTGVIALGVVCAALAAVPAQQPFKGGTDLVSVYATVTDRENHLVSNLTQDQFTVVDNGKVQPIALFSNEIQPITIVIMLDRSGSMTEHFALVTSASREFIRRLLPADRARVGAFGDRIVIRPDDFTSDSAELTRELRRLSVTGASPLFLALDRSISALLPETGRRVVLVFTDGHDHPRPDQRHTELKDVLWRADYNEVMMYTIGFTVQPQAGFSIPQRGRGGRGMPPIVIGPATGKPDPPDKGLKKLAESTGGGYFELTSGNDLAATFARVADELHHQYVLAFQPQKLDGKLHKLEVRLKPSGYVVRARRNYVADPRR